MSLHLHASADGGCSVFFERGSLWTEEDDSDARKGKLRIAVEVAGDGWTSGTVVSSLGLRAVSIGIGSMGGTGADTMWHRRTSTGVSGSDFGMLSCSVFSCNTVPSAL
jgi:hypothetical protein